MNVGAAAQAAETLALPPQEVQCNWKGLNEDCPVCDGCGYVPAT